MLKPLESDRVRRTLEPYLVILNFIHDDVGGSTVEYSGNLDDDEGYLRWFKINRLINELGGSWRKATKYSRGHWRVPILDEKVGV
jgi:hypothetical protein